MPNAAAVTVRHAGVLLVYWQIATGNLRRSQGIWKSLAALPGSPGYRSIATLQLLQMSKRDPSLNSFAALSLHEEREPRQVLRLQKSRHQEDCQAKKDHINNRKASAPLTRKCINVPATDTSSTPSRSDSGPESPGLLAALEAIAAAEQQQVEAGAWCPEQQAAAVASSAADLAHLCGESSSPSQASEYLSWVNLEDCQDSRVAWGLFERQHTATGCSSPDSHTAETQQQQQQQQQQWCYQEVPPSSLPVAALTSSQAYHWRCLAMSFAEVTRAAGDEQSADALLQFGASELLSAALAAVDEGVATELKEMAQEAAAAGLTVQELLQAQQEELLLQIDRSRQRQAGQQQSALGQHITATVRQSPTTHDHSSYRWAAAASNKQAPAQPPCAQPRRAAREVGSQASHATSNSTRGWQQVTQPLCASPEVSSTRGWPATPTGGVKLLHAPPAGDTTSDVLRPGSLDLYWDLRMDGLAPIQRDDSLDWSCTSRRGTDALAAAPSTSQQAAERTRQLLAEQAAGAAARRPAGGSSRCGLTQGALRDMMDKVAGKESRVTACREAQDEDPAAAAAAGVRGSKAMFTYSWSQVFKAAVLAGWEPVGKADGGGGGHFKLRRLLPLSKVMQTMIIPCTPSDSQRGVRHVAAAFKKREEEKLLLEAQAAAAAQEQQQRGQLGGRGSTKPSV